VNIHTLRVQFDRSFWNVYKDLVKLEALEEWSVPPADALHDLEEHMAAHQAMMREVARALSPARTRPLPFVRV